jgi:hypothetical protein
MGYVWRLPIAGVCYAILYVLFGACVFLPIASQLAPEALAAYNIELPAWVLPFQVLRAMLWALLTLPVMKMLMDRKIKVGLTISLLYAVLMGANLLRATDLPFGLRLAHLMKVTGANFCFGWIVTALLYKENRT